MRVNQNLAVAVSCFPILRLVTPARLHAESDSELGAVEASLTRHLAKNVGKTVTDLSILGISASSITELQELLSVFDVQGRTCDQAAPFNLSST